MPSMGVAIAWNSRTSAPNAFAVPVEVCESSFRVSFTKSLTFGFAALAQRAI